jgi:hypothetical protein
MPSPKVASLTKQDIAAAAKKLDWNRQLPKWTVMVDGRELPARPLILKAAAVPPNDSTNSHQAVAILQQQGFDVRYQGRTISSESTVKEAATDEFIHSLRGSGRGDTSLVQAREREHRIEKGRS